MTGLNISEQSVELSAKHPQINPKCIKHPLQGSELLKFNSETAEELETIQVIEQLMRPIS